MVTRGRREERGQDGDEGEEKERGRDGDERERRGEENFIPIDKDPFNPLSLCSIAGHIHGMVTRGRREETAPMMRMVSLHLCIVLYNVSVCT